MCPLQLNDYYSKSSWVTAAITAIIPSYQVFCNDSMHRRHGGGVLLYIKTVFTVTVLPSRHGNMCWSMYFVLVISSHVLHLLSVHPWLVWYTCSNMLESGYIAVYRMTPTGNWSTAHLQYGFCVLTW